MKDFEKGGVFSNSGEESIIPELNLRANAARLSSLKYIARTNCNEASNENASCMSLYKWEGHGHYLGATVIVAARTLGEAKTAIKETLDSHGLPESWERTEDVEVIEISEPKVVYVDNGDY